MNENVLQWGGNSGHYEVWYLTLTDRESSIGFWLRYTMVAPISGQASCSLWFTAMDGKNPGQNFGEKLTLPIDRFQSQTEPFRVEIGNSALTDYGAQGEAEVDNKQLAWDLSWQPRLPTYSHVHPLLRKTKLAKTVVVLPHPDLEISGKIKFDGREIEIVKAKGGQAHLWGSKHASRWVWAHCNDFERTSASALDAFVDGVSVYVPRFGRELGPNTPILARIGGRNLSSIGPADVMRSKSEFDTLHWRFETRGLKSKIVGRVDAQKETMVGVTYHDPDGELAYCYNTEVADMRIDVFSRVAPWQQWNKVDELLSEGCAHFEYAQREPLPDIELRIG